MEKQWKIVIKPRASIFKFEFREIWKYRDLCLAFVKKNFTTMYKQTVFGPLYMILAPLLTSGIFTLIFGNIAKISTDETPQFLFYMSGNLMWSLCAGCLGDNMNIFGNNAYIFGKVYFPRLVIPISSIITKFIKFSFELFMFVMFYLVFLFNGADISANLTLLFMPLYFIELAALGFGIGMIVSSMTVKYKDIAVIVGFGMKIWMYASPVIYPISSVDGVLRTIAMINPLAPIIELFRYGFFGNGIVSIPFIALSVVETLLIFFVGLILFNKVEKNFIDTI